MEFGQKVGWNILLLIPSLIGGLGAYEYLGGWIATIVWVALMAGLSIAINTDKLCCKAKEA
jgi:hypothetical protein